MCDAVHDWVIPEIALATTCSGCGTLDVSPRPTDRGWRERERERKKKKAPSASPATARPRAPGLPGGRRRSGSPSSARRCAESSAWCRCPPAGAGTDANRAGAPRYAEPPGPGRGGVGLGPHDRAEPGCGKSRCHGAGEERAPGEPLRPAAPWGRVVAHHRNADRGPFPRIGGGHRGSRGRPGGASQGVCTLHALHVEVDREEVLDVEGVDGQSRIDQVLIALDAPPDRPSPCTVRTPPAGRRPPGGESCNSPRWS